MEVYMLSLLGIKEKDLGKYKNGLSMLTKGERNKPKAKAILKKNYGTMSTEAFVAHVLEDITFPFEEHLPKDIRSFIEKDLLKIAPHFNLNEQKQFFALLFTGQVRSIENSAKGTIEKLLHQSAELDTAIEEKYFDGLYPELADIAYLLSNFTNHSGQEESKLNCLFNTLKQIVFEAKEDVYISVLYDISLEMSDIMPFMYAYHARKSVYDQSNFPYLFVNTLDAIDKHLTKQGFFEAIDKQLSEMELVTFNLAKFKNAISHLEKTDIRHCDEHLDLLANAAFAELIAAGYNAETCKADMHYYVMRAFHEFNNHLSDHNLTDKYQYLDTQRPGKVWESSLKQDLGNFIKKNRRENKKV